MVLNCQKQCALNFSAVRVYVRRLRRVLWLGRRDFNVCFVNDREIQRLNVAYLGRPRPTDVLAFPWQEVGERAGLPVAVQGRPHPQKVGSGDDYAAAQAFKNFLGDVVISVEAARRNARSEGHSTLNEIRWLILHGVLHLLGHDHESDRGEMTCRELALREQLRIAGSRGKSQGKNQASSPHG
jgi:rRNA maturation RNase YbeY